MRDLAAFAAYLPRVDYVGEVGLDYSSEGRPTQAAQVRVFERILALPDGDRKVWTIHSRRAEEDVVRRLEQMPRAAALHWYTGPASLIDRACARVLTETDAPFTIARGAPTDPREVRQIVRALASVWGVSEDEAKAQVYGNMAAIFSRARGETTPGQGVA